MLDGLALAAGARPDTASLLLVFQLLRNDNLRERVLHHFEGPIPDEVDLRTIPETTQTVSEGSRNDPKRPSGWLSDPIINVLLELIEIVSNLPDLGQDDGQSLHHRVVCFNSFVLKKGVESDQELRHAKKRVAELDEQEAELKQAGKQLSRQNKKDRNKAQQRVHELIAQHDTYIRRWILNRIFPQTELLLFPVNPSANHWCTFAVFLKACPSQGIFYFDPNQYGEVNSVHTRFMKSLMLKLAESIRDLQGGPWSKVIFPDAQMHIEGQTDIISCGPIMISFTDIVARGLAKLGPESCCSWSSAAVDALGGGTVRPLSKRDWPAVRGAMLRLFCALKAELEVRQLCSCITDTCESQCC